MRSKFTQSFKIQAVEKALNRTSDVSLSDIVDVLGVGYSTLTKWITQSRNQEFEPVSDSSTMITEKRPQDWSLEEKLNARTSSVTSMKPVSQVQDKPMRKKGCRSLTDDFFMFPRKCDNIFWGLYFGAIHST